jgi:hypothetical protein
MGIDIDSTGKVYVAHQVHQLIKKFTCDGTLLQVGVIINT